MTLSLNAPSYVNETEGSARFTVMIDSIPTGGIADDIWVNLNTTDGSATGELFME